MRWGYLRRVNRASFFVVLTALLPMNACLSSSGGGSNDRLYSACETTADCQGSGLLCDERRGCVECIDEDDCSARDTCRRGVCEPSSDQSSVDDADGGSNQTEEHDETTDASPGSGGAEGSDTSDPGETSPSEEQTDDASNGEGPSPRANETDEGPSGTPPDATDGVPEPASDDGGSPSEQLPDDKCTVAGQRVVRLPATFRDFSNAHPDFGEGVICGSVEAGLVGTELNEEGRPIFVGNPGDGCITSEESFAEWYVDGDANVQVAGELVLFDDGEGGFVNRFGANGEQILTTEPGTEEGPPDSDPECSYTCELMAPWMTGCAADCRDLRTLAEELADEYDLAVEAGELDATELSMLQADATAALEQAEACDVECAPQISAAIEECAGTCKPCSYDLSSWCAYGTAVYQDGNPLFFPVDDVTGPTRDPGEAKLPEQYGYVGWPWEEEAFGEAVEHNFSFTSHVAFDFVYTSSLDATLEFLGDDDVWVFVNSRLAVDLGGVHVPLPGLVTINAESAGDFELSDGGSYTISIFHAERRPEGSSFRLRLSGFGDALATQCAVD